MIAFGVLLMAFFVSFSFLIQLYCSDYRINASTKGFKSGQYERTMVSQQRKGKYEGTQSHAFLLT